MRLDNWCQWGGAAALSVQRAVDRELKELEATHDYGAGCAVCITLHYRKVSQKRCFTSLWLKLPTFTILNIHAEKPLFEGDWQTTARDFESLRSLHFISLNINHLQRWFSSKRVFHDSFMKALHPLS